MENSVIDWENMGNSSIKMELEELLHEQTALKDRIIKLSEKLESVEKEYYYGNKVLVKRYKGEE
jgi:predicted  nucleic acid-binding Zn-ribbon protein